MPNSLLRDSFFRRSRREEAQISSGFEGEVRDSSPRLLLFQQAAKSAKADEGQLMMRGAGGGTSVTVERAFSPRVILEPVTWGVAPGWYR